MKRKRRSFTHVMEDDSLKAIKSLFPSSWVVRDYKPDYGIDIAVEIFDAVDESGEMYETSGEFFFGQVKSIEKSEVVRVTKYSRHNVEIWRGVDQEGNDADQEGDAVHFDVIKYKLDVPLVNTVLAMGAANPVMLFVVDLDTLRTYFICINDYAEKILRRERDGFENQKTVTIEIPEANNLQRFTPALLPLRTFAKRSKYYAAFNKFNYQRHQLQYGRSPERLLYFLEILREYDFWDSPGAWRAIAQMKSELDDFYNEVLTGHYKEALSHFSPPDYSTAREDLLSVLPQASLVLRVKTLWDHLVNLSLMHEEIVREWFLPTVLGHYTSG